MNWLIRYILFAHLLLLCSLLYSQEHIINGSFEDGVECPSAQGVSPKYWDGILTPDYYKGCSKPSSVEFTVPKNSWGVQLAKDGIAYFGIWGYKELVGEFIQSRLQYPLEKNQRYYVEFYASRADKDPTITSSLGVYFTSQSEASKRKDADDKFVMKYTPYVSNPDSNLLSDADRWYKISGVFTAKGGEQYILIGNSKKPDGAIIKEPEEKKRKKNESSIHDFYYYIDCVSLYPVDSLGNKIDIHAKPEITSLDSVKEGESIVLDNIYFETGKSQLLTESHGALDKLASMLEQSPMVKLEISGHTDNTGTEESNQELSESRAKSVVEYLAGKGITPERLRYKGYGSTRPIADNETEAGRGKNRRVEFMILEK